MATQSRPDSVQAKTSPADGKGSLPFETVGVATLPLRVSETGTYVFVAEAWCVCTTVRPKLGSTWSTTRGVGWVGDEISRGEVIFRGFHC